MTKQEEIREGTTKKLAELEGFTWDWVVENKFEDEWFGYADELLSYQDSQGVVIKADRELPKNPWSGWKSILDPTILGMNKKRAEAYKMAQDDMAGYVAVEPLIKDDK